MTVYDVGVDAGQCYIVADFLQGIPLHRWLEEHNPTWQEAAGITAALAETLAYAHAHRTVHRDVKPENIILLEGLVPVLVDFGLGITEADVPGAERGRVAGTLPYMSPEQVAARFIVLDGRTDIYSLGVVLYRMLRGRLPFAARDWDELKRQSCTTTRSRRGNSCPACPESWKPSASRPWRRNKPLATRPPATWPRNYAKCWWPRYPKLRPPRSFRPESAISVMVPRAPPG